MLVRPRVALGQLESEEAARKTPLPGSATGVADKPGVLGDGAVSAEPNDESAESPRRPTRFHGSVTLDPTRVGKDAGNIAEEVIAHLVGLVGADVTVTLEIEAIVPGGVSESVVRIVTENGRSLKFTSQGFEVE